jgi:hypothetical protein
VTPEGGNRGTIALRKLFSAMTPVRCAFTVRVESLRRGEDKSRDKGQARDELEG